MTGLALLAVFGFQGCGDDDSGKEGGKIPPPRLPLRYMK